MSKVIIHLLEAVEIAQQDRQRYGAALGARELSFQLHANGTGIGQPGQEIGPGGIFRVFKLQRVFYREAELWAGGKQQAQMVIRESLFLAEVQSQYAGDLFPPLQRDGKGGLKSGNPPGIAEILRLGCGVAVENRFLVLRHPARDALSQRDLKRNK